MNEPVTLFEPELGIGRLSPEQTVMLLRCFMADEGELNTARKTGISVMEARQCTNDLWQIFTWRKENSHGN